MKVQFTAPPQHRLYFSPEPQGQIRPDSPRLPTEPFLNVRRTPLLQCPQLGSAGLSRASTNARFPGFRNRSSTAGQVLPVTVSNSRAHFGFRRASHAFLSIPDFGFHARKGTAGSCDRQNEPQDVPKSCFVGLGARLAGTLNFDPAFLKTLRARIDNGRTNSEHYTILARWLGVPTIEKRRC
jgi:hypothetical protein